MIREYCDVCEAEVADNRVSNRLKRKLKRAEVEVLVSMDGTWNKGHICLPCLMQVIAQGDDVAK